MLNASPRYGCLCESMTGSIILRARFISISHDIYLRPTSADVIVFIKLVTLVRTLISDLFITSETALAFKMFDTRSEAMGICYIGS